MRAFLQLRTTIIALLFCYPSTWAATYTCTTSGNWNNNATWGGAGFPVAGDVANVPGGFTLTIASGRTESCATFNLNSDGVSSNTSLVFTDNTSAITVSGGSFNMNAPAAGTANAIGTVHMNGGAMNINGGASVFITGDANGANIYSSFLYVEGGTLTIRSSLNLISDNASAKAILDMTAANSTFKFGNAINITGGANGQKIDNVNGTIVTTIEYIGGAQTIYNNINGVFTYYHLKTTGNATKTLQGSTTINGDFTLGAAGATTVFDISTNTADFGLKGSWICNSTNADPLVEGTQTVSFVGTANSQSITNVGDAQGTEFYNLTFNNTFGTIPQLDLSASSNGINVTNNLTMSSGVINLGALDITLGTASASLATITYTSGWVYGTGGIIRWMPGSSFTMGDERGFYPVGSVSDYRPFWLAPYTCNYANGTLKVVHTPVYPATYTAASHNDATWGNTLQGVSESTWDITSPTTPGVLCGTLRFDISFGGNGFGTNTLTDLDASLVASCLGTFVAATGTSTQPFVNRTNLTKANLIQSYRIGTRNIIQSPLPIELLKFEVEADDQKVDIKWETASEKNNDYFTVEKTLDGINFETITTLKGAGNSSINKDYQMFDHHPYPGLSYYRLKQTDYDGHYSVSAYKAVNFKSNDPAFNFCIYPNPSDERGSIFIDFSNFDNREIYLTVYNIKGEEMFSREETLVSSDSGKIKIDLNRSFPVGIYLVKAISGNKIRTEKLIIN